MLVEPTPVSVAGGREVLDGDEIESEQMKSLARTDLFFLLLVRSGGGGFDDGNDFHGFVTERVSQFGESGNGQFTGGRGNLPVALLREQAGEILKAGNGGAVRETN